MKRASWISVSLMLCILHLGWQEQSIILYGRPQHEVKMVKEKSDRDNMNSSTIRRQGNNAKKLKPTLHRILEHIESNGTRGDDVVREYLDSLLDFATLGFAKTSTSYHLRLFSAHPEINALESEDYHMRHGEIEEFVKMLYGMKDNRPKQKVGYKDPHGIKSVQGLSFLGRYFPSCQILIGLRHPVDWFESFYNFLIRNYGPGSLPPAGLLFGKCIKGGRGVCVDRSKFHDYLALLGKTNLSDPKELDLLSPLMIEQAKYLNRVPNKVFLYEISQIRDKNLTRKREYKRDLSTFLGLNVDFPADEDEEEEHSSRNHGVALDICSNGHIQLRQMLMDVARSSSLWIRRYFLQSSDVLVSSPDYFEQSLQGWMKDPCPRGQ